MRKNRLVTAGLCAVALFSLCAFTPTWEKFWGTEEIAFVYPRAGVTRDSSSISTPNNSPTTATSDTTESVDMRNAHYRGPYGLWGALVTGSAGAGGWAVTDTMYAFDIVCQSAHGDTITGCDSNLTTVQVSPDNVTWTSLDTLGINTKLKFDLTVAASKGVATVSFFTTQRGIGTDRINWDKPACNFIRLIHTNDVGVTTNRKIQYYLNARR